MCAMADKERANAYQAREEKTRRDAKPLQLQRCLLTHPEMARDGRNLFYPKTQKTSRKVKGVVLALLVCTPIVRDLYQDTTSRLVVPNMSASEKASLVHMLEAGTLFFRPEASPAGGWDFVLPRGQAGLEAGTVCFAQRPELLRRSKRRPHRIHEKEKTNIRYIVII